MTRMETNLSNNEIIKTEAHEFTEKLHANKIRLGIHHKRTQAPKRAVVRFRYVGGEIQVIGVIMTKGDVMTHKGKGKFQERGNREQKEWFNPEADAFCENLADKIAINTGDVIVGNLLIR